MKWFKLYLKNWFDCFYCDRNEGGTQVANGLIAYDTVNV